ncbi:Mediator of RNA polymerase II transcription subunit 12 [Portunus trituberculatus]|uniref:Mediator of RNA polymerase II transcription subunit 12 n=1 Tax=Portunus trituberculatus TaxID=210409 RepID=A0A5B7ET64_PORTR|nr:Mediator of RNA polymerase II transcription subunit 12 [Portunus trituberculatus]
MSVKDLDEWSLRISWLDLHLMYEQQRGSPQELNTWLDNVAQAAIEVFHLNHDQDQSPMSHSLSNHRTRKPQSICLVAPLISKLPKAVQGRVLKVAGQVLESVNFGAYSGNSKPTDDETTTTEGVVTSPPPSHSQPSSVSSSNGMENVCGGRSLGHWPLASHRPFLQLVLMCLDGQDDQLSELLESLRTQLTQSLFYPKEEKPGALQVTFPEDCRSRQLMLEALSLRFALVGGLFDFITSSYSNSIITEWALLLVNLITFGVIDLTNNSELFNTVLDMLATLIHSTLMSDAPSESREENRRHYYNLVKKIKKQVKEEVKAPDTPTSDQSPRGASKRGCKNQRTRRRASRPVPTVNNMASPTMQAMTYQPTGFTGPAPNQWNTGFGQQQPPQQQQPFFNQQPLPPASGTRFSSPMSHSRVAIRQMLGQRHPGGPPAIMTGQPANPAFTNMPTGAMTGMARQGPILSIWAPASQWLPVFPYIICGGSEAAVLSTKKDRIWVPHGTLKGDDSLIPTCAYVRTLIVLCEQVLLPVRGISIKAYQCTHQIATSQEMLAEIIKRYYGMQHML